MTDAETILAFLQCEQRWLGVLAELRAVKTVSNSFNIIYTTK